MKVTALLFAVVTLLKGGVFAAWFDFKINNAYDPDISRNVSQLITSKGYPVEEHLVQTKDGYLLGVQRIPHGRKGFGNPLPDSPGTTISPQQKEVVFLQHGLLSASSDFVLNFPEQSLGFILADRGYDVWMGNVRGNTYSRRHVKLTPKMAAFWNFSFDEMAEYDLPAMIDYVLNITQQKQLFYIGHSQGTTVPFALLSQKPEYNEKIKLFVAMGPVATVGHITSAIKYLAPFTTEIEFLFKILGVNEFFPSDIIMKYLSEYVCDTKVRVLCENVWFLICGSDSEQMNMTRIGVYTAHTPAGSSSKSVVHFAQMVNTKNFVKYDYGKKGNMREYNQTTPPEYDVSKITTPVALAWALNDALADPDDVVVLQGKLKTLVDSYCVPFPKFNHGDFVYGVGANRLLYDHVLALLTKYSMHAKISERNY